MTSALHTAKSVQEILRHNMQPLDDWKACRAIGPIESTATALIFQIVDTPTGIPLAAKCTSPLEAREQFEALGKVAAMLEGVEECTSPAPVAVIEASGILIMDWINGRSFQRTCLTRNIPRSRIEHHITQSATLLAGLHKTAQAKDNVLDTNDFLSDIEVAFKGKAQPRSIQSAVSALRKTARHISTETLSLATLHGDFKPSNLIIQPPEIFVIDAAMKWKGATVHDAAHFLNQFALDLHHPKAWRLRPWLNSLEELFLSTCETAGDRVSRDALQWLRLQKLIILYADYWMRGSISSRYLTACIRLEIRRISKANSA